MTATTYRAAVAGWTAHLRAGGTTPWRAWEGTGPAAGPTPDAVQLGVLHRLNVLLTEASVRLDDRARDRLVDLVLATARPGRGPVDVPLPWPDDRSAFGTPPTHPDEVPLDLRLAHAGAVLLGLALRVPTAPAPPWWRVGRGPRPVEVLGPPATAELVRRSLERSLPRRRWRAGALQVVLALPLDLAMAEVWGERSATGGAVPWPAFWRRHLERPPAAADPAVLARRAAEVGPVRVAAARGRDDLVRVVGELVGVEVDLGPEPWPDLEAVDVLRRVAHVSGHLVPRDDLAAVLAPVRRALAATRRGVPPRPAAPVALHDDVAARAAQLAADLRHGHYAVAGDGAVVAAVRLDGGVPLRRGAVLDRTLLAALHLTQVTAQGTLGDGGEGGRS